MSPSLAAERLALAATPVFAAMALLAATDGGTAAMLCGAASGWSSDGMATMYLLMSVFHARPWLERLGRRTVGDRGGE